MIRSALLRVLLLLPLAVAPGAPGHAAGKGHGCEVAVYFDAAYSGEIWRTTDDQPNLGPHWAKQITSLIIIAGVWDFYMEPDFHGEAITLPPGAYPYIGDHWNDKIVSFRCVRAIE